jgi:hypothetical protein
VFKNSELRTAFGPRSEEVTKYGEKPIMKGFTH